MSVSDKDIYSSAKIFMDRHGEEAIGLAHKKQADLINGGDMEGAVVWLKIAKAIAWLQSSENIEQEKLH